MQTSASDPTTRLDQFIARPRRAMWSMAVPMMIGMSLQTLYMIVDMIFIGMLGPDPLTAAAFCMPLVFLGLGITFGLGSGLTAVVARAVGARDVAGADRAAENGLLLGLGLTAFFTLLGTVWGRPLLTMMGVPDGLMPLAWTYFGPIVYGYFFFVIATFLRSTLAGEGEVRMPMVIQGSSTLLNIALDPLFMFTFDWGIWGASVATVVSQAVAAIALMWMVHRKGRRYVTFNPRHFRPSSSLLGDITRIGAPASFSMLLTALGGAFFNRILVRFSPDAVAAYQVGARLDHVVLLPMISISAALVTLVAMFRGAQRFDLVRDVVRYALTWAVGIGAVTALLFFAFAPAMVRGFSNEAGILAAGTTYLRIIAWGYPFVGLSMLAARILQGLGFGTPVLVLTVMRLLLIAAPVSWALVFWFDQPVEAVWYSMLAGVVATAAVSIAWLRYGLGRVESRSRVASAAAAVESPAEPATVGYKRLRPERGRTMADSPEQPPSPPRVGGGSTPSNMDQRWDVVVVGAGNAALCAALAARQQGARVLVLERAIKREHGGNSRFTMASMRFAYDGVEQLAEVASLSAEDRARADFGAYPESQYRADLERTSGGRTDLVGESRATMRWLKGRGVRFVPLWGNQSFVSGDGRHHFWGGLTLQAERGGPGLVLALRRAACKAGIRVQHETRAVGLVRQRDGIAAIEVERGAGDVVRERIATRAVVLACGGFEANAEWRAEHLGAPWRFAKVRGTRHNTGDGIAMALLAGARASGQWSGCHAVQWDLKAPETGDLHVRHAFQKHSYPLGILVNARGERFVDEGLDFRNYTYARYGRAVLEQPGRFAWQVFDARTRPLLRDEYDAAHATRVEAPTLEELARGLDGVDAERFLATVAEYNRAVDESRPFDPSIRDGRRTHGLAIDKTNWANRIDRPPFAAFAVTCGITFTYGGLAIDPRSRVLDESGRAIPGLYAAGELVGGLFWDNYPGGAGLMAGAVFGRRAGAAAAGRLEARPGD